MNGVVQLSAGQQGLVGLLNVAGNAYWYVQWSNTLTYLTSNAVQVTTGYDAWGHWTVGVVFNYGANNSAYLYTPGSNTWSYLWGNVWQMSKESLGVVSVLFSSNSAEYFDLAGWHYLTSGVAAVA
jgi:hypothetical protein